MTWAVTEVAGRNLPGDSAIPERGTLRLVRDGSGPESGVPALRILVVDDDDVDRMAVRRALLGWPEVTLVEVEDAAAALAALAGEEFSCAFVDYRLPGKDDGLTILRAARAAGVRTPVIVLTAHGDEETAVEMMKAGAADYIPKASFSAERLMQSLRNAIRLHATEVGLERAQDELRASIVREQVARAEAEAQRDEHLRALRQVEALLEAQKRTDELREQLIAVVGHDLRSPLMAITAGAQLLVGRHTLGEADQRGAERILRSASRMDSIIGELLDFARARVGGGIPLDQRAMTNLDDLCREALGEARLAHPEREFEKEGRAGSGLWDRDRLRQVIANLIGNAAQHGGTDDPIRLILRDEGDQASLSVQNTGPVIPAELLPSIFEPFRGSRNPDKRERLGLGLFITHEIVTAHGGTISVSSSTEGTMFTVRLPRQRL
jgi:phosphoserine phosphatase RsbU/P